MAPNTERLANIIQRETRAELEQLADQVMHEHELRMDQCQTIPLERRGKNIKLRPNTALISYAARRATARRQLMQIIDWGMRESVEHFGISSPDYAQAIAVVSDFLARQKSVHSVEHRGEVHG